MLGLLESRVPAFGGGRNSVAARRPLVLEKNGLKLALLGYNGFKPKAFAAGPDHAGCAWIVEEEILADIKTTLQEQQPDILIPFMHWGFESELNPNELQTTLSRKLIAAGATAVVGAHPHVFQGVEHVDGKPIVYSLGNFVFDNFKDPNAYTGCLWRATIDRQGVSEWDTIIVRIDKQGIPHLDTSTPCAHGRPRTGVIEVPRLYEQECMP